MPALRRDAVTGALVLLAPERAGRPDTVSGPPPVPAEASCPFCPGHEQETPPEVLRTGKGAPGAPGWRVRVFPNLFPIVDREGRGEGGGGAHEVVVLSPDHDRSFGMLRDDEAVEVLGVVQSRARHHLDVGCAFVQVVVNQGRAAGASIAHPHAQVLALEFVPPAVEALAARFAAGDVLAQDRSGDAALALGRGPAPVWCPQASRTPYVVRVAPPEPSVDFPGASDTAIAAVAVAARDALAALRTALDDPAYNLVVHTAPPSSAPRRYWFVEIVPRVSVVAGFEQGTGVFVNTVDPRTASAALRDAWP